MTGPEHYREAERLADQANHFTYGDGADPATGAALAAEAQVHATLALAVATAEAGPRQNIVPERARPLVEKPLPGDSIDPPYPGNDWGRVIYGEATP